MCVETELGVRMGMGIEELEMMEMEIGLFLRNWFTQLCGLSNTKSLGLEAHGRVAVSVSSLKAVCSRIPFFLRRPQSFSFKAYN
jgi:hypothetical protein